MKMLTEFYFLIYQQMGHTDQEVNNLTKLLFILTLCLSTALVLLKGVTSFWYIYLMRFIVLFSSIIPIKWVNHVSNSRE